MFSKSSIHIDRNDIMSLDWIHYSYKCWQSDT